MFVHVFFDPEMVESSCIVKSGKSRKITENHGNVLTLPSTEMGGIPAGWNWVK